MRAVRPRSTRMQHFQIAGKPRKHATTTPFKVRNGGTRVMTDPNGKNVVGER